MTVFLKSSGPISYKVNDTWHDDLGYFEEWLKQTDLKTTRYNFDFGSGFIFKDEIDKALFDMAHDLPKETVRNIPDGWEYYYENPNYKRP